MDLGTTTNFAPFSGTHNTYEAIYFILADQIYLTVIQFVAENLTKNIAGLLTNLNEEKKERWKLSYSGVYSIQL